MNSFITFTKKEFIESLRTYKLFVMGIVFLLLGMMNPVIAKYTPVLLESVASELNIEIPEPSAIDSWTQFFGNVGQIGLLTLIIIFSGIMSNELSRGTLINILTKGLKRGTVILSKLLNASVIWTVCYLMCIFVTYFYTLYFWEIQNISNVFIAFFCMWLFGILMIVLLIFGGSLFMNIYGSLLLTGGAVVFMTLLNINPNFRKYNPITLSGDNMSLLTAQKEVSDFIPAIVICAVSIILFTVGSIKVFNKKQI